MPLAKVPLTFYDRLKTVSKGYASFDYYPGGMKTSKLVSRCFVKRNRDALSALIRRHATPLVKNV